MKTIKKPKSRKKLLILLAVLIVLAGAGTTYAAMRKIGPFSGSNDSAAEQQEPNGNDINHNPPTDEQIKAGEKSSEQKEPAPPSDSEPGTPPDNGTPTQKRQAEVMIDSADQTGATLKVRASINTIDADSKCTATLTRGNTTAFNETVATQTMPSYSMCKGFDIPLGSVAKGVWDLKVVYESKNFKGEILQEVTVQ